MALNSLQAVLNRQATLNEPPPAQPAASPAPARRPRGSAPKPAVAAAPPPQPVATPAAQPAPLAQAPLAQAAEPAPRPAREGKRLVAGHFDPKVSRQLRLIAAEEDTTIQALLEEALDLLFVKKGKSPLAGSAVRDTSIPV